MIIDFHSHASVQANVCTRTHRGNARTIAQLASSYIAENTRFRKERPSERVKKSIRVSTFHDAQIKELSTENWNGDYNGDYNGDTIGEEATVAHINVPSRLEDMRKTMGNIIICKTFENGKKRPKCEAKFCTNKFL
jgi:hypothetical protein